MSSMTGTYPQQDADLSQRSGFIIDPHEHAILVITPAQTDSTCIAVLEAARYQVHSTSRSTNLKPLIERIRPDLLVLEVEAADPTTIVVCEQVRHSQGRGFLPTILLADDTDSLEQLTEAVGRVDGYLVKPLNHQVLLDQIHNLLSVRHYVEAVLAARNEQQAHMLKQVQTLDVLKNAVVRNVSHEMRTPVLQIKSAIALMAEEISGEQPPEVASLHKLLNMATQATARLENTVASITQLAEIQNLKVEPFLLSESVELATRTLQRSWQSRDNQPRIVTYYAENLPPAFGDKRGIAQVLQQLLDNALKFSPDGGPVEVHIAAQDEDTIRVDVRDYGIGIAPDKLDHIFDEFYQIEASSTRRFSGVGIGLTLAKLILEQLGSSIQVESAEGVGSTFSFVLPRAALD